MLLGFCCPRSIITGRLVCVALFQAIAAVVQVREQARDSSECALYVYLPVVRRPWQVVDGPVQVLEEVVSVAFHSSRVLSGVAPLPPPSKRRKGRGVGA